MKARVAVMEASANLALAKATVGAVLKEAGITFNAKILDRVCVNPVIKDGVVEDLPPTMDDTKLKSAVDLLLAKHPPEAVAVYLNAFNDMNEANWTNLKAMLESDTRLQLGAAT